MPTEELLVTVGKMIGVLDMTFQRHLRDIMLPTCFIQYLFLCLENVACCAIGSFGVFIGHSVPSSITPVEGNFCLKSVGE